MSQVKFPLSVLIPIKKHLLAEEKRLRQKEVELVKEDPFSDQDRVNDNAAVDTEAAEEAGHDRVSALKQEVEKALIRIKKTLTKIKLGKYGLCDSCHRLIDTDRLAVDPTVTKCISCANQDK